MRDSLEITYRFRLPGGPGSTNADETPAGRNLWIARYGDCPPLRASSGGGSSSTLVNGVILAVLTGFLALVFGLRALRRRRRRPASGVSPDSTEDLGWTVRVHPSPERGGGLTRPAKCP